MCSFAVIHLLRTLFVTLYVNQANYRNLLKEEVIFVIGTIPSGDVAHPVLSPHGPAVSDFDLQAFDLLGELDALGVAQRFALFVGVAHVQHFAHEVDDRLGLVEGSGTYVDIEHHFPLK